MGIAQFSFSPDKLNELRNMPIDKQIDAFYQQWTRQEAFFKLQSDLRNSLFHEPPDPLNGVFEWYNYIANGSKLAIAIVAECSTSNTANQSFFR